MVTSTGAFAPPPVTAELFLIADGDQDACNDLVKRWDTVVSIIAAGHAHRHADRDDLTQVGRLAVVRANAPSGHAACVACLQSHFCHRVDKT